jgi:hypothetical protein
VYQFRLQGCKGVVAVDPSLQPKSLLVRPSMVKFKTDSFPKFAVCGFSRPYNYGHLNRQLVYLLSGLGVPDEHFLALQREYFDLVFNMETDPQAALTVLQRENKFLHAEALSRARGDHEQ